MMCLVSLRSLILVGLLLLAACGGGSSNGVESSAGEGGDDVPGRVPALFGFTPFPYELTTEAVLNVNRIIAENTSLYVIHMDQCLPWQAALSGGSFPAWLVKAWAEERARIPVGHVIYIAMTPTHDDRHTPARACGETADEFAQMPEEIAQVDFDDPLLQQAYVNYVRRVVDFFRPSYINIGIEISELAINHPEQWPKFEALYIYTLSEVKKSHPKLQVGLELVLQSLMLPRVAEAVKFAVEQSDYIGISFYPYADEYGVQLGAPPLPDGMAQWRTPLDWLRDYTDKPIAICETGYTTQDVYLESVDLWMYGDEQRQLDFVRDLIDYSQRDEYLFVVWFVPVDYEQFLIDLGANAKEIMQVWVNTGLFRPDLAPKLAWQEWQDRVPALRDEWAAVTGGVIEIYSREGPLPLEP